eukprot:Hpha_TRINITY_DN36855_c0_g1::TRINITY_DN36855_c0_g1_i1::g.139812::m.139812
MEDGDWESVLHQRSCDPAVARRGLTDADTALSALRQVAAETTSSGDCPSLADAALALQRALGVGTVEGTLGGRLERETADEVGDPDESTSESGEAEWSA